MTVQVDHPDKGADGRQLLTTNLHPSFTVTEAIESAGFGKFQYIICAINGFSWFATATEIMLLAILAPSLKCEWDLSTVQQGLMAASLVGSIFGLLTAFSPSFLVFLVTRFFVGFSIGGIAQSVTLSAEFLPAKNVAKWMIVLKSFFAIGTAVLTALAIVILPNFGWRWLVAYAAFPLAGFGLCCWWLPESVRFDVAKGRVVEARATLDRVAHMNGRPLPPGELLVEKVESSSDMLDLLKSSHRRTTILLWIIWTLFGLLYYGFTIYTTLLLHSRVKQESGACSHLTTENYIDIIVTTMSELPGYFLTMYAVDIIGRRGTFVVGFAIVAACSAVLTLSLPRFLMITTLFVGRSAIASVFQAGYMYASEVYPTSLRGQGLGVASGWGRFGSMITPVITRMLFAHNIIFPAIVYCAGGIFGAVLAILLPIETSVKRAKKAIP